MNDTAKPPPPPISIKPLLQTLRPTNATPPPSASADEIAFAMSNVFTNQLTPVQMALFLYTLNISGLEQRPDVLAKCASAMRTAAVPVDIEQLREVVRRRGRRIGSYNGGLCDIVGTGGDGHSTFNISTASSIVASSLLVIAKHGNRASTSSSGSADVLQLLHPSSPSFPQAPSPKLEAVDPTTLLRVYEHTNYGFLFAPNFHQGMRHSAAVRRELPHSSIFNLLGPLSHPTEAAIEARVVGVRKRDLVDVFAAALRLGGARKALVVCGDEDLDEISCAGPTHCARLSVAPGADEGDDDGDEDDEDADVDIRTERFMLSPRDFGLPAHPLSTVAPGGSPAQNAAILHRLLSNALPPDDPILHFILINTAALLVVAGVCDGEVSAFEGANGVEGEVVREVGPGGGRWKEGVRLARLAISSGRAMEMVRRFAEVTVEV